MNTLARTLIVTAATAAAHAAALRLATTVLAAAPPVVGHILAAAVAARKTIMLAFLACTLANPAPAEAQTRAGRVALGVASAALGVYALAYDPPDASATVHGAGSGPYSWEATHEDFQCRSNSSLGAPIRIQTSGRGSWARGVCYLIAPGAIIYRGRPYLLLHALSHSGDDPRTWRVPDNTTYSGGGTVTVRTTTPHTAIVNRSPAQIAAGAGLIIAGAALALWPDPPVEVDVDPGPGRIRLSRTFGF